MTHELEQEEHELEVEATHELEQEEHELEVEATYELELEQGEPRKALKSLLRGRAQNPEFAAEAVDNLRRCYRELGDDKALKAYYLECLDQHPTVPLLLVIAEDLRDSEGEESAARFLMEALDQRPSLRGVASLLELQMQMLEGEARDKLGAVLSLVERLVAERPSYRCGHCGFSGRQLHWSCPSCKHWGVIHSIRNTG